MGVFISYSQKDKEIAYEVCHELEKKDIYCWIAPRNIDVGENWANQIVTAIEKEENYIVILSENSMRSNEVLKELTLASEMKKNIFALCVDGCEPTRGYKYHLSIAQRLDIKFGTAAQVVEKLEEKITGKKKEKPLLKRKGNKVEIVTYKDLVERGFTSAQIAERLVANDKMLYPHIDQEKRYEQLGFKFRCNNMKSGKMYVMDLVPYPAIPLFRKRKKLKKMYEDKFRVDCRQLNADDYLEEEQLEEIAGLIYDTDEYIYPAMFETRDYALELIPELMNNNDAMFRQENLYIAEYEEEIAGILLWKKGALNWSKELFEQTAEEIGVPLSPYLDKVTERYFNSYADEERADVISIINLCVSENARGLGIGKKLMESFLRQHRGEKIELCVLEENKAALDLYKKMGFKEVSRYQGFSVDERDIVCIGMEKY